MKLERHSACVLLLLTFCLLAKPVCHGQETQKQKKAEEAEEDEPKSEAEKAKRKELEIRACGSKDIDFSAKTDKKQHPTPEATPDKALVFVIRPTMMGNKIQTKLAVDGHWMGANRGDNYFFFTLEPGEHYFCSKAENQSLLVLKAEAGKAYYLQQKVRLGFLKARNKLVLLDENEGKDGLTKCHLSIAEEEKK